MSGSDKIRALIAQKDKQRKKRKLTAEERKRLSKLKALLAQLKRGKNVQNRTLKTWLSTDEYDSYEAEWQAQLELREQLKDKPAEITEYERLLKNAIFSHNRADSASNSETARNLRYSAEAKFEDALEFLHENLKLNPSLNEWLDRHVDTSPNGNITLSLVGMPRAITSRSLDKHGSGIASNRMTKREVKIDAVDRAIDHIQFE